MIRTALSLILMLSPLPLAAQAPVPQAPAPAPGPAPKPATVRVTLTTTLGPVVLELERDRAPITTANFLRYVKAGRLDGISFFRRVQTPGAVGDGFIQAGVRDSAKLFPPIAHEPTTRSGLSHVDGAVSMARFEPGTARGDFVVTVGPQTYMDADPARPGDNAGYAVFGRVVEGMDIVRRILAEPADPNQGEGMMRGQYLANPVRILTARRAR